jgi:hypothetical protein
MQMGRRLLKDLQVELDGLNHRNFAPAKSLIESNGERYFTEAAQDVAQALTQLYGQQDVSLQQLSATFRRGDMIRFLEKINL